MVRSDRRHVEHAGVTAEARTMHDNIRIHGAA